jgi:hypothetical protein
VSGPEAPGPTDDDRRAAEDLLDDLASALCPHVYGSVCACWECRRDLVARAFVDARGRPGSAL